MADKVYTTDPSKPVKLRIAKEGFASVEPITIVQAFRRTVEQHGGSDALAYKEDGVWKKLTFKEYYNLSVQVAKSFLKVSPQLINVFDNLLIGLSLFFATNH